MSIRLFEGPSARLTTTESSAGYQRLVASQANFDKVMARVNEAITKAMDEAGESRIVIPS